MRTGCPVEVTAGIAVVDIIFSPKSRNPIKLVFINFV
jgi:hypothetical protein